MKFEIINMISVKSSYVCSHTDEYIVALQTNIKLRKGNN